METEKYTPMQSVATISNAMDVGDPSILFAFKKFMIIILMLLKKI